MFVSSWVETVTLTSTKKNKKIEKSIHRPFVTILSRQTLLSCAPASHNLFNPTLPRQKHFYLPNRHHPSSYTRAQNKNKKANFQTSTNKIKQDQSNNHRSQGSSHASHLILTHDYGCYREWNFFFLSFLHLYPTCMLFPSFSGAACFKAAIHGHEDPAIPRATRAPKGFHLKLCRPPNRAVQAHPADSAGDPSSDTEATDDVSALLCNKLA